MVMLSYQNKIQLTSTNQHELCSHYFQVDQSRKFRGHICQFPTFLCALSMPCQWTTLYSTYAVHGGGFIVQFFCAFDASAQEHY